MCCGTKLENISLSEISQTQYDRPRRAPPPRGDSSQLHRHGGTERLRGPGRGDSEASPGCRAWVWEEEGGLGAGGEDSGTTA